MTYKPQRGVIFLCKIKLACYAAQMMGFNFPVLPKSNHSLTNSTFTVITGTMHVENGITGGRSGSNERNCKTGKKV